MIFSWTKWVYTTLTTSYVNDYKLLIDRERDKKLLLTKRYMIIFNRWNIERYYLSDEKRKKLFDEKLPKTIFLNY